MNKIKLDDSPIVITLKCNRKCIFCSRKKRDVIINTKKLKKLKKIPLSYLKSTITIEGGEPLISNELIEIVRYFKQKGVNEIMLMTNGYLLSNSKALELLNAGVKYFNINFPSHIEKLFDLLTGTKMQFNITIKNIKDLLKITNNVVITEVINSLNYQYLPKYLIFISKNFNSLSYLSLNMIKVLGKVKQNKKLVPKLSNIEPYLSSTFALAKKLGIKIISDGIPLCFMKDYEDFSIDIINTSTSLKEKIKVEICKKCIKNKICSGIRKDYIKIYGSDEIIKNYFK